jgi:aryl-alcohol dehydrogenase-like predicted oxidoreductase
MNQVRLPNSAVSVPQLIFGTGEVMRAGVGSARHKLLRAALDAGFTHFDTAPYYGFGQAERDLGSFAKVPELGITTKVGLYPPGGAWQPTAAALARKAGGRLVPALSLPIADFAVTRARKSLDGSLKRLRRERVDLLLIHEPVAGLIDTDEWLRWLEQERAAGRVRDFGVAGQVDRIIETRAAKAELARVVQTSASSLQHPPFPRPQIVYGLLRAAAKRAGGGGNALAVLQAHLQEEADVAVIVATKRRDRVQELASAAW